MPSACKRCGSTLHHTKNYSDAFGWSCSDCARIRMTPCYDDIYLGGKGGIQTDPNIVHPKTGVEIPFSTKQDKAVAMKIAGVKQAVCAERVHGYRNESHLNRKSYFEVR